jgi:hypothetical protein
MAVSARAFDKAALAGARPLAKRREDALHRPYPDGEVANRQTGRGRRAVGLAGHMHDPPTPRDQVKTAAPELLTPIQASPPRSNGRICSQAVLQSSYGGR